MCLSCTHIFTTFVIALEHARKQKKTKNGEDTPPFWVGTTPVTKLAFDKIRVFILLLLHTRWPTRTHSQYLLKSRSRIIDFFPEGWGTLRGPPDGPPCCKITHHGRFLYSMSFLKEKGSDSRTIFALRVADGIFPASFFFLLGHLRLHPLNRSETDR